MIWLAMRCEHEGCDSVVEATQREGLFALVVGLWRLRRLARRAGWWLVYAGREDYCPLHLPPFWTDGRDV